jgi:hypothetical protein
MGASLIIDERLNNMPWRKHCRSRPALLSLEKGETTVVGRAAMRE